MCVGKAVGAAVGSGVGWSVGDPVGALVGASVVGAADGAFVGLPVGAGVGLLAGAGVGYGVRGANGNNCATPPGGATQNGSGSAEWSQHSQLAGSDTRRWHLCWWFEWYLLGFTS